MRMTAVAVMTVVLVSGSALGSAAQEHDDFLNPFSDGFSVVRVTGVHEMGYMVVLSEHDVSQQAIESVFTGGERTTDPRVTGRWHWRFTFAHAGDYAGAWWGPCGLQDAEGGEWEGFCTGVRYQDVGSGADQLSAQEFLDGTKWEFDGWYTGTQEFEGLVYYAHVSGDHGEGTLSGVIYEGDPPPMLE